MSLLELPLELLNEVLSYLEYVSDVNALSQTHPRLYPLVQFRVSELLKTEDPPRALVFAAQKGNEAAVRKLLKVGALFPEPFKPNHVDAPGDPMAWAAKNGHVDIVKIFLEHGRDPTPLTGWYRDEGDVIPSNSYRPLGGPHAANPLMLAARKGHESVVRLLIEYGVDLQYKMNAFKEIWEQPLSWAVFNQNIRIIKLLLENGCDPNVRSVYCNSALHVLASASPTSAHFDEILELLFSYGADPHTQGGRRTPFECALDAGNVPFVKYCFSGDTSFDTEQIIIKAEEIARTHPKMAALFLDQIDLNQAMKFNGVSRSRLFCVAASGGFEDLMKRLFDGGYHYPPYRDDDEVTEHLSPMARAVASGHLGIVNMLLEHHVDLMDGTTVTPPKDVIQPYDLIYREPIAGDSAMVLALHRGHDEVFKLLMDDGLDYTLASAVGPHLLFERAMFLGRVDVIQQLFDNKGAPSMEEFSWGESLSLSLAVLGGEAVFEKLLENGLLLDPGDDEHISAFAYAAMLANSPILEMFLDAGFEADMKQLLDFPYMTEKCATPLILAAHAKNRDHAEAAVDLLLRRGASINQPSGDSSHSPLFSTCTSISINLKSMEGDLRFSILSYPNQGDQKRLFREHADYASFEVLATQLLLKKGADPLFWSTRGESPLSAAARTGNNGVVKLLLDSFDLQNVPIRTIERHIRVAASPYDASLKMQWEDIQDQAQVTLTRISPDTERLLWQYYWPRAYPVCT